ncbi:MAG: hypothetical protein JXD21_02055 [Candidatus Omnitrophica bacterium]|nr:hypothetical protein [Candidatus Omnitrophota bacterium]
MITDIRIGDHQLKICGHLCSERGNMTPVEALQLALEKEDDALTLYRKLALEHHAVKDIFEFLVNEEEKHKKILKERIHQLQQ